MKIKVLVVGLVVAAVAVGAGLLVAVRADDGEKADGPDTTSTEQAAGPSEELPIDADLDELVAASGLGDPATIEIPAPDGETRAWLEQEGAAAVELVTATEALWATGAAACEPVAEALDAAGDPGAIAGAAAGSPDHPTQDILLGLQTATEVALGACAAPEAFETARAELAWQWALADRRLAEIGIER